VAQRLVLPSSSALQKIPPFAKFFIENVSPCFVTTMDPIEYFHDTTTVIADEVPM